MDCLCHFLPTPQQILAANTALPYCDAHGCFEIPLVAPPSDTTASLLLTAAIIGAATVYQFYASTQEEEECA